MIPVLLGLLFASTTQPLTPVLRDLGVIVKDKSACVRDPTQVMQHNGKWHFWATHNPECTNRKSFPRAEIFHYHSTTSDVTGLWNTSGVAISHGEAGQWDAWSVFTPGAIYDQEAGNGAGLWYLWYGAVANGSRPTRESIGLATSLSPFGPWARSSHNPVFNGNGTSWCVGGTSSASARVDEADPYIIDGRKVIVVKGVCKNFTALPTAWTSISNASRSRAGSKNVSSTFEPPYMPVTGANPMVQAAPTPKQQGFEQARVFSGPDGLLHMIGHDHAGGECPHYVSSSGLEATDWRKLPSLPHFGLATNEATPVFAGVPGDRGGVPTHFIQFDTDPEDGKLAIHLLSANWH